MAAYFYTNNNNNIFRVKPVQPNVHIGFLDDYVNPVAGASASNGSIQTQLENSGFVVINEVVFQNRDTIQFFLTFDDLVSYFYFGKGLGTMTITGSVMTDCYGDTLGWGTLHDFMQMLGSKRGQRIGSKTNDYLTMSGVSLEGVLSSFTVRASAELNSLTSVDFTLQLDIIASSFRSPTINSAC